MRSRGWSEFDGKIGAHPRGISRQHDDAIRQQHRFFDVVRDDENRARRHLLAKPQLEQFVAQVFRREHVECGKGLIHEQDFGLNHQRTREADALFHAARKLLRVSALEAIQSDGIENAQGAFVALHSRHTASFERRFDVVEHSEPGKQSKALEDDGHARVLRRDGLPMPQDRTRRRRTESGQNPQQRGLTAAGGTEQGNDFAGLHVKIDGRNNFNAIPIRLLVELFDSLGANDGIDGLGHGIVLQRETRSQVAGPRSQENLRPGACSICFASENTLLRPPILH